MLVAVPGGARQGATCPGHRHQHCHGKPPSTCTGTCERARQGPSHTLQVLPHTQALAVSAAPCAWTAAREHTVHCLRQCQRVRPRRPPCLPTRAPTAQPPTTRSGLHSNTHPPARTRAPRTLQHTHTHARARDPAPPQTCSLLRYRRVRRPRFLRHTVLSTVAPRRMRSRL
jgi:hypothetical protein